VLGNSPRDRKVIVNCVRPTVHTWIERLAVLMRRTVVGSFFALLLAPSQGSAQALQSFEDLALRVNLDDQLKVEDQSGVKAAGRLIRLKRDEMAIQTDAGEKRFTSDTVHEVAVRGYALRKSALIGAAVVAVLGAVATCSNEGGAGCAFIGLRAAPFGAGVGLAVGSLIPQMNPIYRAPKNRVAVPVARAGGGVHASVLEDIALRVNLDDQLRVEDQSGGRTTGALTRLTADGITIQTDTGEKHFTVETVRQIAVRRRPLRMAVLIGGGAGAVTGALAACTGHAREECGDAPILAGGVGASLGLAVGALIHRTTIVYPAAEKRTLALPVISRDAVGVRVSRSW
jgi:hypothetical protein